MKAKEKPKRKPASVQAPPSVRELGRMFRSRRAPNLITQAELEEFRKEVDRWMRSPVGSSLAPYPRQKADNLKALVNAGWKVEPGRLGIRCSRSRVYVDERPIVESSQTTEILELGDSVNDAMESIFKLAADGNEDALDALDDIKLELSKHGHRRAA